MSDGRGLRNVRASPGRCASGARAEPKRSVREFLSGGPRASPDLAPECLPRNVGAALRAFIWVTLGILVSARRQDIYMSADQSLSRPTSDAAALHAGSPHAARCAGPLAVSGGAASSITRAPLGGKRGHGMALRRAAERHLDAAAPGASGRQEHLLPLRNELHIWTRGGINPVELRDPAKATILP